MSVAVLTPEQIREKLMQKSYPAQNSYLAMYSTWWGGILKEPGMMLVPIDDHLVHRGDGVFEAIKAVAGMVYLLDEHLARLESSAKEIGLALPMSLDEMKKIILQTTRAAGVQDALLRLYISRGPGGFTTNPYDSVSSQMYLVVTSLKSLPDEKYVEGVKVGKSAVPPKEPWLAKIKTCNYLPNVLMKKESVDRNLDFTIGIDAKGSLLEGSTENIVMIDKNGVLVRPYLKQILKGTTMMRTFTLAEDLVKEGLLKGIEERDISEADIQSAREVMMIGTTLDVLPVTSYEGQKIADGKQGEVSKRLLSMLREDMKKGPKTTPLN
jgi:branched-chain amino acid aminotransferase